MVTEEGGCGGEGLWTGGWYDRCRSNRAPGGKLNSSAVLLVFFLDSSIRKSLGPSTVMVSEFTVHSQRMIRTGQTSLDGGNGSVSCPKEISAKILSVSKGYLYFILKVNLGFTEKRVVFWRFWILLIVSLWHFGHLVEINFRKRVTIWSKWSQTFVWDFIYYTIVSV